MTLEGRGPRHTEVVRLFVGVWPPPDVQRQIGALERPETSGVRWTTADQWHVTLRFFGEVPDDDLDGLRAGLVEVAASAGQPPEAALGPAVVLLGRGVLAVPVEGLAAVARAVTTALGGPSAVDDDRPFRGHLTLARGRGGRAIPRRLAGAHMAARWRVGELCLIASTLSSDGARYTTVASATVPS